MAIKRFIYSNRSIRQRYITTVDLRIGAQFLTIFGHHELNINIDFYM